MVIQSIASSYTTPTQTKSADQQGTVSKDDFLRLLVTQLQKQDPLDPSDPTEFTAQLAQFSSLEQLISVNDNLGGLATQESMGSRLSAAGLIGKTVKVQGNNISVSDGKAGSIAYQLPADSTATSVNIYNASGDLVDVVTLGQQASGSHTFAWDGALTNGTNAGDGTYQFQIVAQNAAGQGIVASSTQTGVVKGVSFDATGEPLLEVGGGTYTLADVLSINAGS